MSEAKKESLASLLSPEREGMKLVNVKFFRGEADLIRPEEFRAQLRAVAEQKREKTVQATQVAPKSIREKVDVRAFVADM